MYAWIGKKRKGARISEDELTSCVFGSLRSMQPKQAWQSCLVMLGLEDRSPCPDPSRVDVRFWPRFPRTEENRRHVEPDVHIIAWIGDQVVATILVEVKWHNSLGEDQLLDQWKWISVDGQPPEALRECSLHVLLSDRPLRYAKQIGDQRERQQEEPEWGNRLVEPSWHDVAWNLKAGKSCLREVETWRNDILCFLASQGIVAFDGFRHLRLAGTGSVEWRFDASVQYGRPELETTGTLEWSFQAGRRNISMTESSESHHSLDAVWQSIENMRRLEPSLSSLWVVLDDLLREGEFFAGVVQISSGGSRTEYDWCWYSECVVYSLKKRNAETRRTRLFGELSVRFELWREVEDGSLSDWPYSKSPLIYVGFDPTGGDFWDEELMYLDQHGCPAQDNNIRIPEGAPWLCEYVGEGYGENWNERSWFFAVPLGAINIREDVQTHIVAPLKALLGCTPPCDAFRDTSVICLCPA